MGLALKGLTAKPTDFDNSVLFLHGMKELLQGILFMLEETFGVRLWTHLNWCSMYMSCNFPNQNLQEISVIVILMFSLSLPVSRCP